ncbi:MAG: flagellar motor protein [Bryobacteraceae bacterium]
MAAKKGSAKPDFATLGGLVIAAAGIVGGLILEGGNVKEIMAPTALMIVLGGTLGAVMVTTPLNVLLASMRAMASVFFERTESPAAVIETLVEYATKARKQGIVALEQDALAIQDPFLQKALSLAVDGTDLQELRKMMELEISLEEHHVEAQAKVFDGAGGYAPTIGIIGAVLGLIQVMKDLADIDKVGHGIATAFVATIYGVGFANILFLPAGTKIRARAQNRIQLRELMLEGVIGIVEGLNPKLIRSKLEAYAPAPPASKAKPARTPADK